MAAQIYTPEWEKEKFEELAPQVIERINRAFEGRGASFGAEKAHIQNALSKLRGEISSRAEEYRAKIAEQIRQEGVQREERIRQEGVSSTENEKNRQSRAQELATSRSVAENERISAQQRALQNYERQLMEGRVSEAEKRGFEHYKETGKDIGGEYQSKYPGYAGERGGRIVDTQSVDDKTGLPFKDEEDERRAAFPGEGIPSLRIGSGFILPQKQGLTASAPTSPTSFNPSNPPPTKQDFYEPLKIDNGGFEQPGQNKPRPPWQPEPPKDYWQTSGDITKDTPNEFEKVGRDVRDTFLQLKDLGESIGEGLGFAPKQKKYEDPGGFQRRTRSFRV